tara:strand:+ start:1468 stop:1740 length:273 start_codon:yes stop_codon:yes gene_type:complete
VILEILLGVAILYSVFVSYLIVLSLRRISAMEEYLLKFQQIVEIATDKMKMVDSTGHYESDDETGFFFKQLKELQELLNALFEPEEEHND